MLKKKEKKKQKIEETRRKNKKKQNKKQKKKNTFITKTRLYNFDPLKPHFYLVKLGFAGV